VEFRIILVDVINKKNYALNTREETGQSSINRRKITAEQDLRYNLYR